MKCKECNFENNQKAKYCYTCGYKFTKEDKEEAKSKGILGIIRKINDINDFLHLSTPAGKIIVILIVIAIGAYNTFSIATPITLKDSDSYTFTRDEKTNTYIVYTDEKQINAKIKLPTKVNKINLELKKGKKVLNEQTVSVKKDLILNLTDTDTYYKINYQNRHDIFIYVIENGAEITEVTKSEDKQ